MKKEELFKAPRWVEYQHVDMLNIKVKETEEDKKKVDEFRKFIDENVEKEKNTKLNKCYLIGSIE